MGETNENLEIDVAQEIPVNNLTMLRLRKPIQYDGEYCFRFLKVTRVPEASGDVYYRVTSVVDNRPDLLSYIFYGTPYLKDFILVANDIIDPFYFIPIGTTIRIPDTVTVYNMLKNLREIVV